MEGQILHRKNDLDIKNVHCCKLYLKENTCSSRSLMNQHFSVYFLIMFAIILFTYCPVNIPTDATTALGYRIMPPHTRNSNSMICKLFY